MIRSSPVSESRVCFLQSNLKYHEPSDLDTKTSALIYESLKFESPRGCPLESGRFDQIGTRQEPPSLKVIDTSLPSDFAGSPESSTAKISPKEPAMVYS